MPTQTQNDWLAKFGVDQTLLTGGADAPGAAKAAPPNKPGGSANEALTKGSGAPVRVADLTAAASVPKGQVLGSGGGHDITTTNDTRIVVTVTATGLKARFDPPLNIGSGSLLVRDPVLMGLQYDYGGSSSVDYAASVLAEYFGDVGNKILDALDSSFLAALPARMLKKGYNPFDDPKLAADLPGIAAKIFPSSAGGGASAPKAPAVKTTDAKLEADLVLSGDVRQGSLSIANGTKIHIAVALKGGLPASPDKAEIDAVHIDFEGSQSANVVFTFLNHDIPAIFIRHATITHGGSISLDYDLATEVIAKAALIAVIAAALQQGMPVGGNLDARHAALRKIVEDNLHNEQEPLFRNLIRQHKDAIPGLDLAKALGV